MSGSGNYDGGGLAGGRGTDPCAQLKLVRVIQAPAPDVIATLAVNQILSVELRGDDPVTVAVITEHGQEAGSIVPTTDLLNCLQHGFSFEAVVLTINGGAVQVTVRATP